MVEMGRHKVSPRARGIGIRLTINLTSEEVAHAKEMTHVPHDTAAVTKAVRDYLRLSRLRELKAISGKIDYAADSPQLESLEMGKVEFSKKSIVDGDNG